MAPAVVHMGMSLALVALCSAGPSVVTTCVPGYEYVKSTETSAVIGFAVGTRRCQGGYECQFKTLLEAQDFCNSDDSCTAIMQHPASGDCFGGYGCFTPRGGTPSNDAAWISAGGKTFVKQCGQLSADVRVKHTNGACIGHYLGGRKANSLVECRNSCSKAPTCKFLAFCPSGTSGCTDDHENKCALYSSCTSKDSNKGYTTYEARYLLAGTHTWDICPEHTNAITARMLGSEIASRAACEAAASSLGKPFVRAAYETGADVHLDATVGCYVGPYGNVFHNTHTFAPVSLTSDEKNWLCKGSLPPFKNCVADHYDEHGRDKGNKDLYRFPGGRRLAVKRDPNARSPKPWIPVCDTIWWVEGGRRLLQEPKETKSANLEFILV